MNEAFCLQMSAKSFFWVKLLGKKLEKKFARKNPIKAMWYFGGIIIMLLFLIKMIETVF